MTLLFDLDLLVFSADTSFEMASNESGVEGDRIRMDADTFGVCGFDIFRRRGDVSAFVCITGSDVFSGGNTTTSILSFS